MRSAERFEAAEPALELVSRERLRAVDLVVAIYRTAESRPVALRDELRKRHPALQIDLNHRYELGDGSRSYGPGLVAWGAAPPSCGRGLRIGVLDTLVDETHPALGGASLESHSVLTPGVAAAKPDHATAIASVLVGRSDAGYPGLLPGAELFVVGAFRKADDGEVDATMDRLVTGLDWLLGRSVDVANLSFVGPSNQVFARVVQVAAERGMGLVAAVGNAGPDVEVGFPARLEVVLGVTAVDQSSKIYHHANRGSAVALAAPGVDLWVARPGGRGRFVSGTSYAAPFAAAALALAREQHGAAAGSQLLDRAKDLGAPGTDRVFGRGLLQARDACEG